MRKFTGILLLTLFYLSICNAQTLSTINKLDFYNLAFDHNGNAWYTFLNHDSSKFYLGSYKNATWDSVTIPLIVSGNTLNDLHIDSHNNVWIACSKGLIKYNGSSFTNILYDAVKEFAIGRGDSIWGIAVSASSSNSIFKSNGTSFLSYPDSTLHDTLFHEIAVDQSGHVFVFGETYFFNYSDTGWVNLDWYSDLWNWGPLSNMVMDANGNLWFIGYNLTNGSVSLVEYYDFSIDSNPIDMSSSVYHSIDIDKINRIRYINRAGYICTFSPSAKLNVNFLNDTKISFTEHSKIKVDGKNFVWVYGKNY